MRGLGRAPGLGALIVGTALLAACAAGAPHSPQLAGGNSAAPSGAVTASKPSTRQLGQLTECILYDRGAAATVLIQDNSNHVANPECVTLAGGLSANGDFWTQQPQINSDPSQTVCIMTKGHYSAYVNDAGGQNIGQGVCSSFLTAGWTEDQADENQRAAAAASGAAVAASAAQVQAQASASESADLAEQAKFAADQTTLAAAASATENDDNFSADLSLMAKDVQQATADLAQTRADATPGPGDNCYNVTNVVGYDATNKVEYDAQNSVDYDARQKLAPDIATLNADNQALASAIQNLRADGVSGPLKETAVISTANQAISHAIATANTYLDQTNADVAAAYMVGNNMATGACAGDGPGPNPEPLPHLN